jgi:hypothetical protein
VNGHKRESAAGGAVQEDPAVFGIGRLRPELTGSPRGRWNPIHQVERQASLELRLQGARSRLQGALGGRSWWQGRGESGGMGRGESRE